VPEKRRKDAEKMQKRRQISIRIESIDQRAETRDGKTRKSHDLKSLVSAV
jgi:hypothetical protein